MKHPFASV